MKIKVIILTALLGISVLFFGCSENTASKISTEQRIYTIFNDRETKDKTEIFKVIGDIDWKKYEQISNNRSMELIEWIYNNIGNIENEKYLVNIISANKNLDGAYSESYAGILRELYKKDKIKLIYLINQCSKPKKENAIIHLAYGIGYIKDIHKDLNLLMSNKELTSAEKEIITNVILELNKF